MVISLFELAGHLGTRISPAVSLASVVRIASSDIVWDATVPAGDTLMVETSIDGGISWQPATNGAAISGLTYDLDVTAKTLMIRETLSGSYDLKLHRLVARVLPIDPVFAYYRIPEDFDLGDIVTVQNPVWGKSLDLRVAEVRVVLDGGKSPRTEVVFGAPWPNLIDSVKRAINQAGPEIRR